MATQEYKTVDNWQKCNQLYRELGNTLAELANQHIKQATVDMPASYMPKANEEVIVVGVHPSESIKVDLRGKRIKCLTNGIKSSTDNKFIQVTCKTSDNMNYSIRACIVAPLAVSLPDVESKPAQNSFFCFMQDVWT